MLKKILAFLLFTLPAFGQVISPAQIFQWNPFTPLNNPPANSYYTYINASGQFACLNPSGTSCLPGGSSPGTVTSVTATGDGIFDSATPSAAVTSSGTLTLTAIQQAANCVFAGPSSGGSANPSCRVLVVADIPSLSGTYLPLTGGTLSGGLTGTTASFSGQITSTLAGGTAPFSITSNTVVPNLNAALLNGATFAAPPAAGYGSTTPEPVAATTLSASSTVSGTGFSTYLASPPAIGGTAAAAGSFSTLGATGLITTIVGSTSAPSIQATGAASNTGIDLTTTALCWDAAGTIASCLSGSLVVGDNKSFGWSQNGNGNGSTGVNFSAVGTSTTEAITPSAPMLMPVCKLTAAQTLTTATTICSFTLPNSAQTWGYYCHGMYQTTTGSITLLLGTQFAQTPTNSTHWATIWSAASTQTYAQATNNGTTAVTTMTGVAPSSSTATPWEAGGTFTGSATSGTFVIYGTASTTSDAQINAGSFCQIF